MSSRLPRCAKNSGFTLIEVLIVVSILALLVVSLFASFAAQRKKAEDARIKADLESLRIAFEDYYNDHSCYPPHEWFEDESDCGSNNLQPYLASIPCNPKTGMPYVLEYPDPVCSAFKIYADLANLSDTALLKFCVDSGGSTSGNYGVSSTNTTIATDCSDLPDPPPPPPPPPPGNNGTHGCQPGGVICNDYGSLENATAYCTYSFSEDDCQDLCGNSDYWCSQ
ncbi:MAG: type II secretion system protein [bacterium]